MSKPYNFHEWDKVIVRFPTTGKERPARFVRWCPNGKGTVVVWCTDVAATCRTHVSNLRGAE